MAARRPVIGRRRRKPIYPIFGTTTRAASPRTADNIVRRIVAACEPLVQSPYGGRARDEVRHGLRSVVASPHIVFYRVSAEGTVEIVRVIDGRRDIDAVFDEN